MVAVKWNEKSEPGPPADDVLESYDSLVRVCQQEKSERVGHPPDGIIKLVDRTREL